MPWQMTRVFLLTRMLMAAHSVGASRRAGKGDEAGVVVTSQLLAAAKARSVVSAFSIETSPSDPVPPSRAPARRRWKIALLMAIVVGAAVAAAIPLKAWRDARDAERRLLATVDRLRRSGAPVALDDLAEPSVRDPENAAPLLREAARALAASDRLEWEVLSDSTRP